MTVVVGKRTLSKTEYFHAFMDFYDYCNLMIKNLAKRKSHVLGDPIMDIVADLYEDVMAEMNPIFHTNLSDKERVKAIIMKFISLQKPMLTYWNIEKSRQNSMDHFVKLANNAIFHIGRIANFDLKGTQLMFTLNKDTVRNADFIRTMCELHSFTYQHIINAPAHCRRTSGGMLERLCSKALYNVYDANRNIPKTAKEYARRKQKLETALQCLNDMNIPLFSVFALMMYGEDTMQKWCDLLESEKKLIYGLLKSDKDRFGSLP